MNKYNPQDIEQKWQKKWEEDALYKTPKDATHKNKMYILPQLPYPSGSGLHVGHAEVYTACDMYARYQRMAGKKVLQVIGWDSFGLPAENYAIKTNVHPKIKIEESVDNFRSQIKSLGISVDWDREVGSHTPEYYKWTQWFFLLFYKRGLVYRKKQAVNWCDSCKTVLANDQVKDGHCERCDTLVVQRDMEQWFLKITEYADRLLEGLDKIDWPEETKKRQRDWIGRSEGAEVEFKIQNSKFKICVFTTRPDTLFGATYMVLAPEHEVIQNLESNIKNYGEVKAYVEAASKKTELERQSEKEKTGVELKGVKAVNPVNGEEIPVWVADYVLASYGTGAIMAVPAHDERDFAFAKKFGLEVREVVVPKISLTEEQKKTIDIYNKSVQAYIDKTPEELSESGKEWMQKLIDELPAKSNILEIGSASGRDYKLLHDKGYSVDVTDIAPNFVSYLNETFGENTARVLNVVENGLGIETCDVVFANASLIHLTPEQFDVVVGKISRVIKDGGYFALSLKKGDGVDISENVLPGERYYFHWRVEQLDQIFKAKGFKIIFSNEGEAGRNTWINIVLKKEKQTEVFSEQGCAVNSDFLNGLPTKEAKIKMIEWLEEHNLGERKVQYKLRDWSVSRQRFWGAPIPMLFNEKRKVKSYKYILLHGYKGTPDSNFFPWLKKELEERGHEVVAPTLPNTEKPNIEEQVAYLEKNFVLSEDTVIVAHSLGGSVGMKWLEKSGQKIIKAILVDCNVEKKRDYTAGDFDWAYDWNVIDTLADEVVLLVDDRFEYVDKAYAESFWGKLSKLRIVYAHPTASHFRLPEEDRVLDESIVSGLSPVPESDLPVTLPDDVDFKPTGQSPLTYSEEFQKGVEEKYGKGWKREVDTLDTFMCSSWYYYRYLDPHNDEAFASPEALKTWMPVDFYLGGEEHVNGHLLYARFFTKVLFDAGYIDFDEPFTKHRHQGLILGPDHRKMSKRWGNVVNPTDVVNEYGADTLRMYEMFMGPLEQAKPWDTNGVKGIRRFLEKVWKLQEVVSDTADTALDPLVHKTIKKVTEDIEALSFNTAIAKMMELANEMTKQEQVSKEHMELFLKLLAPFAPHIAEELWHALSHEDSVTAQPWPMYDKSKVVEDTVTLAVQVNGKVRATVDAPADISEDDAKALALEQPNVEKWLDGKEPKKVIYVKGKLVSIVR